MNTKQEIYTLIAGVFHLQPCEITENMRLIEDLGADSLDMLTIVAGLEKRFGVAVEAEDINDFATPGDIAAYIERVSVDGRKLRA